MGNVGTFRIFIVQFCRKTRYYVLKRKELNEERNWRKTSKQDFSILGKQIGSLVSKLNRCPRPGHSVPGRQLPNICAAVKYLKFLIAISHWCEQGGNRRHGLSRVNFFEILSLMYHLVYKKDKVEFFLNKSYRIYMRGSFMLQWFIRKNWWKNDQFVSKYRVLNRTKITFGLKDFCQ